MADAASWRRILAISREHQSQGLRPLIVCSAIAGVSNLLDTAYEMAVDGQDYQPLYRRIVQIHRGLCESLRLPLPSAAESLIWQLRKQLVSCGHEQVPSPACKAKVMAIGELLLSVIGQAWLMAQGLQLEWLDARNLLQSKDQERSARHYLSAQCSFEHDPALAARLAWMAPQGALTQGFIAQDVEGETILLGRGGSDTSAACLAARLGASRLEIWTDVPGLFSANPHQVPQARQIQTLSYDEAESMAYRGAKVLHPRSLEPLRRAGIPLQIRCTGRPELAGTAITGQAGTPQSPIQALLSRDGLCHLSLKRRGTAQDDVLRRDLTACFARHQIGLTSLSLQADRVSILIDTGLELPDPDRLQAVIQELLPLGEICVQQQVSSVSLIGPQLPELWPRLETMLADSPGTVVLHCSKPRELTWVMSCAPQPDWLQALHHHLIESEILDLNWQDLSQGLPLQLAS